MVFTCKHLVLLNKHSVLLVYLKYMAITVGPKKDGEKEYERKMTKAVRDPFDDVCLSVFVFQDHVTLQTKESPPFSANIVSWSSEISEKSFISSSESS